MEQESKKIFVTSEIQSHSRYIEESNSWLIRDRAIDKLADEIIKITSPKHEYKINDTTVELIAVNMDEIIETYLKDGRAGTYSRKLRQYVVEILNR